MIHLESKFLDSNTKRKLSFAIDCFVLTVSFFFMYFAFTPFCDSTNSSDGDKTFFPFFANKFPYKLPSFIRLAFPMTDFIYLQHY